MINVILSGAKYLIILMFAVFAYVSFRAQTDKPEDTKKGTYFFQKILVLLVHLLSFLCIYINVSTGNVTEMDISAVLKLYIFQLAYLIFMLFVLPVIIHLSRGLNNVMCMLIVLGFVIQIRLDYATGLKHFYFVLGATVLFILFQIFARKLRGLSKLTWVYCILGILLLLIMYFFAGINGGAKVSLNLGFVHVQPFEFLKILFVFFIAAALSKATDFKMVVITAVCAAVHIGLLVMCTELGTALILAVVYVLMLYVATKKFVYILLGAGLFAAACVLAYKLFSHVQTRVDVWLNPWIDIDNKGYQITQSLFAIGTGGWLGSGLYGGEPNNVPMIANDFVFSAIAEEFGAIFAIFLIIVCLCLILMIFRVAIRISNPFSKLMAFGLGTCYGFQVFLTVGGAIKFVPSTGINLPFISSGGSSIFASMIMLGIVQALYVISEADVEEERSIMAERIVEGLNVNEAAIWAESGDSDANNKSGRRVSQIESDEIDEF